MLKILQIQIYEMGINYRKIKQPTNFLRARSLVVGDMHLETKDSRFESGC